MKTRESSIEPVPGPGLPDAAALSALRAWHEGLSSREAVARFIPERRAAGASSRAVIGTIRRQIAAFATERQRDDLARHFTGQARKGAAAARAVAQAVEALRNAPIPQPLIGDEVGRWLPPRVAAVLRQAGIRTLAELTLRVPRRKRWWSGITGLGPALARQVEGFFAAHPKLTERARALLVVPPEDDVRPWERIVPPVGLDGSMGTYRAPRASCSLRSNTDYEAVQAWLTLHEAPATRRAYRREAERLVLWAVVERGLALSSLSTEDATAYRTFLRHPAPRVGGGQEARVFGGEVALFGGVDALFGGHVRAGRALAARGGSVPARGCRWQRSRSARTWRSGRTFRRCQRTFVAATRARAQFSREPWIVGVGSWLWPWTGRCRNAAALSGSGLCRRSRVAQRTEPDVDVGKLSKTALLGGRQLALFSIANGVRAVLERPFNNQ
ncbi:phage integrase family protein [Azohydromonas aeria]|uniref:phage integrase family protein n=1 Tax=Azohydromonas aeria TaxID=2590212 RepID=UPI0012F7A1A8|nr:phage integrase family protein [Azohydromonas aeria]